MGRRGIAPQLFRKFPALKTVDQLTPTGDREKLGKLSFYHSKDLIGFNLYGQYHCYHNHPEYGTRYGELYASLLQMRGELEYLKDMALESPESYVVGFPLIGCGLAGGDWEIVSELIERAFEGFDGEIRVYTLNEVKGLTYQQ